MDKLEKLYYLSLSPKKCGKVVKKIVDKKLKLNK